MPTKRYQTNFTTLVEAGAKFVPICLIGDRMLRLIHYIAAVNLNDYRYDSLGNREVLLTKMHEFVAAMDTVNAAYQSGARFFFDDWRRDRIKLRSYFRKVTAELRRIFPLSDGGAFDRDCHACLHKMDQAWQRLTVTLDGSTPDNAVTALFASGLHANRNTAFNIIQLHHKNPGKDMLVLFCNVIIKNKMVRELKDIFCNRMRAVHEIIGSSEITSDEIIDRLGYVSGDDENYDRSLLQKKCGTCLIATGFNQEADTRILGSTRA